MTISHLCTAVSRRARTFLVFVACGWALLGGAQAQLVPKTLVHLGLTRTWYEHVPASYDGTQAVPLVISLHGSYTDGAAFALTTDWITKSDAAGFIVVFPTGGVSQGTGAFSWHAFFFDGSSPDDAGFLVDMIAQVQTTYRIDPARIYMSGFSAGGAMTTAFAGRHSELLAAIAPISGEWPTSFGISASNIQPSHPLPVWLWRGDQENFADGSLTLAQQDQAQLAFWSGFDGDSPTPQTLSTPPFTTEVFSAGQAEVRFTSIAGATHAYQPGVSAKIWDEFFSRFQLGAATTRGPTATLSTVIPQAVRSTRTPATVLISLDAGVASDLLVHYTVGGSAAPGLDYKVLSGEALVPAGSAVARIKVKPRAGGGQPGARKVKFALAPGAGYVLGAQTQGKVKIVSGN